jgi:hypothetical protein
MSKLKEVPKLFINPNGVLCNNVIMFGKHLFTMIDVYPVFDGYDINGDIIDVNDWCFEHSN